MSGVRVDPTVGDGFILIVGVVNVGPVLVVGSVIG
jgi:hypothetical protein